METEPNGLPSAPELIRLLRHLAPGLEGGEDADRGATWLDVFSRLDELLQAEHAQHGTNGSGAANGARELYRRRYQEFLDTSPDGYLLTDAQGVILEANLSAAEMLQTRKEFLLGKPFPLYVREGERAPVYTILTQMRENPETLRGCRLWLRPGRKGDSVLVAVTVTGVVREGRPLRCRWLLRDLTEATWAERALQAEKGLADSILEAAQAIVLVLDARGQVIRSNPYAQTVTGLGERELAGREWALLLSPHDQHPALDALRCASTVGVPRPFTARLAPHGAARVRTVTWSVRALPLGPSGEDSPRLLEDAATRWHEAQQHALQAERLAAVGQFTAALAHESRNLIQASQASLERLSWRLQDQPELLDLVGRVQTAQRGLVRLMDDVRSYAAPLSLELGPCNLAELWRDLWAQVQAAWPDREASFDTDTGGMDLWCSADRFRLGQVLWNLLDNTFAACPGPVAVLLRTREANVGDRPAVRITYRDNGPGLTPLVRERLFEPFYTTKPKGSGLGMAIAKRIMEAHGGQIAVGDSGPPGAEFILLLPRSQS